MVRIGVISDTHGLMRPSALTAHKGADLIVHAGDVGKPDVLDGLRGIAPTRVVRGIFPRHWTWMCRANVSTSFMTFQNWW